MSTRIAFTESSSLTPTTLFAASGSLAVGDVVCQVSSADKTVAKADADNASARPPIGVVHEVRGTDVVVALNGEVASGLSGLTRGTAYWLSTTAGALVATKPATNAYIVGVAVSASEILVNTVAADLIIGGGGSGTVTSFGITSSDLTVSNSPLTASGTIDLALNTVPVSKGGTGQTTKTAAFDALSPATAAGSLIGFDGTNNVAVPVDGTKYLVADSAASAGISYKAAGTVTSAGITSSDITVSNSPITSSGVIDLALNTVPVSKGGTGLTSATEQGASLIASSSSAYVAQATSLSWRNRIINGDMRVAQRGTAAVSADSSYPVDRWIFLQNTGGTKTVAQSGIGAGTGSPVGLNVKVTVPSTATASQYIGIGQRIEGSNIYDFGFGTPAARPLTLSFWVYSSIVGTYGVMFGPSGSNNRYVADYTISVAKTWSKKTITVPGATVGSWSTDSSIGMVVWFDLGSGSNYRGTTGAWDQTGKVTTTNQVNFIGSAIASPDTSNDFYLTSVQLELGSVATPFEMLQYEKQLELCQRYYARLSSLSGNNVGFGAGVTFQGGASAGGAFVYIKYPQQMRASPTLNYSNTAVYNTLARTVTSFSSPHYGTDSMSLTLMTAANTQTVGQGVVFTGNIAPTWFDLTAEL